MNKNKMKGKLLHPKKIHHNNSKTTTNGHEDTTGRNHKNISDGR